MPKTPDSESFYGVVKSYNERRGFGFVACEEIARRYGRDAYLSKDEALELARGPVAGTNCSSAEESPPIREGDYVQFQVQQSAEGYPQAVYARRVRRLRGTVLRGTGLDVSEGSIIIQGDGTSGGDTRTDIVLSQLIGTEVRVRQTDSGQLWLDPGDEVAFCCGPSSGPNEAHVLEAMLIDLISTQRAAGSPLGCFTLALPRTPDRIAADDDCEVTSPASSAPPVVVTTLDGYALTDRVVLAGLPVDLAVPELMRLFAKLGASEAFVMHSDSGSGVDCGYASITFSGPTDVARMLSRAAHTINEQGITQLARLGPSRCHDSVPLPALPAPTITLNGSTLLVRWSQVGLAAGYVVELRPATSEEVWTAVAVSGAPEDTVHKHDHLGVCGATAGQKCAGVTWDIKEKKGLPFGALGPQCTACKVNHLKVGVAYEARVTYFAPNGCRSQPSASSAPLTVKQASETPCGPADVSEMTQNPVPESGPRATAAVVPGSSQPPESVSVLPAIVVPLEQSMAPLMHPQGLGYPTPSGWRCVHCSVLPPPASPELVPVEDAVRSVCIQWPTVVHSTAYIVELLEEGSMTAERFARAVPESLTDALVELRVGNLNTGAYAACVRSVGPCGCESGQSGWAFLPPAWIPSPSLVPMGWQPVPDMGHSDKTLGIHLPPLHPAFLPAPPVPPVLATNPSGNLPPPPASQPPPPASQAAVIEEALILD